jgi:uncharacterized membrane protein
MKYNCEVIINVPRERVIELFDNPDNMSQWQPGLQSFEPLSGEPGQPGAKSKLVYDMNGRRVEMVETIVTRNLPEEFSGTYETKGVKNLVSNYFYNENGDKTRWFMENEFKFSGVMMLMSFFMRGAIRKQTLEDMHRFKAFAESAT